MQPKEEVYQKAKQIVLNQATPSEPFQYLAKAIKEKWNANLVNGDIYEYIQLTNPMRLRLLFRKVEDLKALPSLWNERQEFNGERFKDFLKKTDLKSYTHHDLSILEVDYFVFDELAFQECVNKVRTSTIRSAFKEVNIWQIQQFWNYFTVFYHTNDAVTKYEALGISQRIRQKFQEEGKKNDPFSILSHQSIEIKFDSKEHFNQAGGGYYYYR